MIVRWTAPKDDGGCPITGYALFRDNGVTQIPNIEVNTNNDPLVRNIPTLREVEVALNSADLGTWYKYEVRAYNSEGSTSAQSVRLLFAVEPDKPSQGPVIVETTASSITVTYSAGALDNGGSPILSHHLQYAEAFVGDWIDANGLENESLLSKFTVSGLIRGRQYSFRFRVKNSIGWSEFSDVTTGLVAVTPGKLAAPELIRVDDTEIELKLNTNVDNGGSVVTQYILQRNAGVAGTTFTALSSYVSGTLSHTVSTLTPADGLVAGKIYTFRWYAVNAFGSGEFSNELTVALAAKPAATAQIRKVMTLSSKSSISVEWDAVAGGTTPGGDILGYVLQVKDTLNGSVWTAFDGPSLGIRTQRRLTVRNLVPGRLYGFTVTAHNFNGAGTKSAEYQFLSCIIPSNFGAPWRTYTKKNEIGIQWNEPKEIGGCDITGYILYMKEDTAPDSSIIEVNVNNDLSVRNMPGLSTFAITAFTGTDLGKKFNIFLRAYSRENEYVDSDRVTILLADVPDKPSTTPSMTQALSSGSVLYMVYPALATTENGGS